MAREMKKVPIIKKCPSREGLQIIQTLTKAEQETCKSINGLFGTLTDKFQSQHKETILSVNYLKSNRKDDETVKDWMDMFRVIAANCRYKWTDRPPDRTKYKWFKQ